MIDTLEIKIEYPLFNITRPELFNPTFKLDTIVPPGYDHKKVFKKFIQNATPQERLTGILKPSLTICRRLENHKLVYDLHIRFSAPKILSGNNLYEMEDSNFTELVELLLEKLKSMGVDISREALINAKVVQAHFGKNILLPQPLTSKSVILDLQKADMGGRMEVNTREFKNKGEALYLYNSSRNSIFYDKVLDMVKDRDKSVDKYKNVGEKELHQKLKGLEILRFEIRLNKSQVFKKWLGKTEITFEDIFSADLSRQVLVASWEEIIEKPVNQLALKMEISNEDVLDVILEKASRNKTNAHSMTKALTAFGVYFLVKTFGSKIVRDRFEKIWSRNSCRTRLNKKIKESVVLLTDLKNIDIVGLIDKELREPKRFEFPTNTP